MIYKLSKKINNPPILWKIYDYDSLILYVGYKVNSPL